MTDAPVRILVVDDEPGIREGCRRILEFEGYGVVTAEDGVAALEKATEPGAFALALVDLKMPRMDGMELIDRLRARDSDLPVIVITAYATIDTAIAATRRGANNFVCKPFSPDELLLHVRNNLAARELAIEARRLREERENRLLEVAYERSKGAAILSCMTDGVVVVNREGQVVLWNAAAAGLVAAPGAHVLPCPVDAAIAPSELRALLAEVLATEAVPEIASREIAVAGGTYMANASPVVDNAGRTLGAVAVLRDITALKQLDAAKSMFVTLVAHEVNRPLAAVESYLALILSGRVEDGEKRDAMMRRALLRSQALRQLVADLMNLTAVQTGKFTLMRKALDLRRLVDEAIDACRDKAVEKRIALAVEDAGEGGGLALADRDAMFSVLTNLIDNAIKYTPEGGHVWVRFERGDTCVRVAVRDDGIGISPQDQEHLFAEFFRARNAQTANIPGTGLGLSLVKRFVDLHQGRIDVESRPGEGSTFTIELPAAAAPRGGP